MSGENLPEPSDLQLLEREGARQVKEADLALRQAWGGSGLGPGQSVGPSEYEANLYLGAQHLKSLSPAEREAIETGQDDSGTALLNNADVLQHLAAEGRKPPGWLLEAAKTRGVDEKKAIEDLMAQPRSRYWTGPDAARLQARYRDLIRKDGK